MWNSLKGGSIYLELRKSLSPSRYVDDHLWSLLQNIQHESLRAYHHVVKGKTLQIQACSWNGSSLARREERFKNDRSDVILLSKAQKDGDTDWFGGARHLDLSRSVCVQRNMNIYLDSNILTILVLLSVHVLWPVQSTIPSSPNTQV